jgi:hypothetical protein
MVEPISGNVNQKIQINSSVCKSINIFRFVLTNNLSHATLTQISTPPLLQVESDAKLILVWLHG